MKINRAAIVRLQTKAGMERSVMTEHAGKSFIILLHSTKKYGTMGAIRNTCPVVSGKLNQNLEFVSI